MLSRLCAARFFKAVCGPHKHRIGGATAWLYHRPLGSSDDHTLTRAE
jgi:hypothetical protein